MTSVSDNWEDLAKSLPTGQKRKITCCGTSPSAIVSNNIKGISYHCFRCDDFNKFIPHGRRSVAEILEARQAVQELREMRSIPQRCIPCYHEETSREAILWLLKGGLTPEAATDTYGMMYDPKTRRVNIPIDGGFLSRAVHGERPKYVKAGADTELYQLVNSSTALVVVCEDIMSAIKVHSTGYNAIAILGTTITATTGLVLSKYSVVVCWTDGDKAGDTAWIKLRKRMALYPVELRRVRTEEDPKNIHAGTIRQLIGEHYESN